MRPALTYFSALVSLGVTLGSGTARAEDAAPVDDGRSPDRGVAFAMAAGLALPAGDTSEVDIDNLLMVPLALGLDVRVRRWLELGASLEYAEGVPVSCKWVSCSGRAFRMGPFVRIRGSSVPAQPWLSVGFGYRLLFARRSSDDFGKNTDLGGPEWLRVEAGLDFARGPRFGPFLFASLGKYTSDVSNIHATPKGGAVAWAGVGVRVTFGP